MSQGHVIDIMTFNSYSLQYYSFRKGKNRFRILETRGLGLFFGQRQFQLPSVTVTVLQFLKTIFFLRYKRYSWQLTVLENVFFKMPQRKVNVITERRIFGEDNDLPRDIRDMKSGFSGDSLLRYSSDTGSMTSVACLLLCILCLVFVKVTAYRHFTFAV